MIKKIIVFSCWLVFISCTSNKKLAVTPNDQEKEPIICSTQFVSIGVQITDSSHLFDEFYLINNQTKKKKRIIAAPRPSNSKSTTAYYTLIDDALQKELQGRKVAYTLIAKRSGIQIIEEPYVFSADACHVFKVSGKDHITTF